jgi:hypothetical protein
MGLYTMNYSAAFVYAPLVGMRIYEWEPKAVWWLALALGPIIGLGFWILRSRVEAKSE